MLLRYLAFLICSAVAACAATSVVVDTDAGSDDLMAIAFLLSRPDVRIEAITVCNGLAHVPRGGTNVLRLLALAGRGDIPVYLGSETPLLKTADFPEEWRRISDELPGVQLPAAKRSVEKQTAAAFLAHTRASVILALGPLTNLALALRANPKAFAGVDRLVIMGGALRVPGNLGDGGLYKTKNTKAEWNIFVDPRAARMVFESGVKIDLIPLDATGKVPIHKEFVDEVRKRARGPLSRFVVQVLESDREAIDGGYFQAWDPLAAAALVQRGVVGFRPVRVTVTAEGQTAESAKGVPIQVGLDANAAEFRRLFLDALH
jgi:inosine-uridine nucleoside N-ribohydrolase